MDDEINESKLENILGGAPKAVINDRVLSNKEMYRPRKIEEIEKEKAELLRRREEILNSVNQNKK